MQKRPRFSLENLQKCRCLSLCDKKEKAAFADKLHQLSQLTWQQIMQADRHGQGCEKISKSSIKSPIPDCVTPDVDLVAFRFCAKAPMVGYRNEDVFFVLWLDRDFTLYAH